MPQVRRVAQEYTTRADKQPRERLDRLTCEPGVLKNGIKAENTSFILQSGVTKQILMDRH